MRQYGPYTASAAEGRSCAACKKAFKAGDYTALVALGPGRDPEAQELAREGRPYSAVAIEVHFICATGRPAVATSSNAAPGGSFTASAA